MSRSGRVLVAFGVPVVVVLAACGGAAPPSGLPTIGATSAGGTTATPTPTSSVTSSSPWTAEQQEVLDRYREYDRVVTLMDAGAALDMARLKAVATAAWAQEIGQNIQVLKAEGFVAQHPSGGIRSDITAVNVEGKSAMIVGCEDSTGMKLIRKGTPEPSPKDLYQPTRLDVTLASVDGAWKVSKVGGEGSC